MTWLIGISMGIIAAYVGVMVWREGGVPHSISATYYTLRHRLWFTLAMWGMGLTALPAMLEASGEANEWAAFLAIAGVLLVGAAPNFSEDELDEPVHVAGAILCCGLSQLWVALVSPWWLILWAAYVVYTLIYMVTLGEGEWRDRWMASCPMFWVEVTALVATFGATVFH